MRATPEDSVPPSKPVSQRKLAANRANAAKSTGPRTPEGKAVSRFNALVHGMAAQTSVLPDEEDAELLELAQAVEADLRPRGAVERALVGRVVSILWRLRRVGQAEEGLYNDEQSARQDLCDRRAQLGMNLMHPSRADNPGELSTSEFLAKQFATPKNSPLERLGVYEQRLDRALHATLRQLQQLRKLRDQDPQEDPETTADAATPDATETQASPAVEDAIVQNEPTADPTPAPRAPVEDRFEGCGDAEAGATMPRETS